VVRYAVSVEIPDLLAFLDLKRIAERLCPELPFNLIKIELVTG